MSISIWNEVVCFTYLQQVCHWQSSSTLQRKTCFSTFNPAGTEYSFDINPTFITYKQHSMAVKTMLCACWEHFPDLFSFLYRAYLSFYTGKLKTSNLLIMMMMMMMMMMICRPGRNLVSHYVRAIWVKTIKSLANNCKSEIFLQNDIKIATYRVGRNHVFSPAGFQLRFRLWLGERLGQGLWTGHFLRCSSIN